MAIWHCCFLTSVYPIAVSGVSPRTDTAPPDLALAEEYAIDHNGAAAAIRAGYKSRWSKQTASRLLQKPDVADLVQKLDSAKRDDLGISAASIVAEVNRFIEGAFAGKYPASVGMRGVELKARLAGLLVERVEESVAVVYTLKLDRDLRLEEPLGQS